MVIIGLMLAFQVDRWWEERGDRTKEQEYITRLITEIKEDIDLISYSIDLAEVRQGFGYLLLEVVNDPTVAEQSISRSNTILAEILGYGTAHPTRFWIQKS